MGKVIIYLIGAIVSLLLLRATGLFDGMFERSNLNERATFWEETVARDAPAGSAQGAVEALMAKNGMTLECLHSSLTPPVVACRADDPASKGGTSGHPTVLQLHFEFRDEKLTKFETSPHVLQ